MEKSHQRKHSATRAKGSPSSPVEAEKAKKAAEQKLGVDDLEKFKEEQKAAYENYAVKLEQYKKGDLTIRAFGIYKSNYDAKYGTNHAKGEIKAADDAATLVKSLKIKLDAAEKDFVDAHDESQAANNVLGAYKAAIEAEARAIKAAETKLGVQDLAQFKREAQGWKDKAAELLEKWQNGRATAEDWLSAKRTFEKDYLPKLSAAKAELDAADAAADKVKAMKATAAAAGLKVDDGGIKFKVVGTVKPVTLLTPVAPNSADDKTAPHTLKTHEDSKTDDDNTLPEVKELGENPTTKDYEKRIDCLIDRTVALGKMVEQLLPDFNTASENLDNATKSAKDKLGVENVADFLVAEKSAAETLIKKRIDLFEKRISAAEYADAHKVYVDKYLYKMSDAKTELAFLEKCAAAKKPLESRLDKVLKAVSKSRDEIAKTTAKKNDQISDASKVGHQQSVKEAKEEVDKFVKEHEAATKQTYYKIAKLEGELAGGLVNHEKAMEDAKTAYAAAGGEKLKELLERAHYEYELAKNDYKRGSIDKKQCEMFKEAKRFVVGNVKAYEDALRKVDEAEAVLSKNDQKIAELEFLKKKAEADAKLQIKMKMDPRVAQQEKDREALADSFKRQGATWVLNVADGMLHEHAKKLAKENKTLRGGEFRTITSGGTDVTVEDLGNGETHTKISTGQVVVEGETFAYANWFALGAGAKIEKKAESASISIDRWVDDDGTTRTQTLSAVANVKVVAEAKAGVSWAKAAAEATAKLVAHAEASAKTGYDGEATGGSIGVGASAHTETGAAVKIDISWTGANGSLSAAAEAKAKLATSGNFDIKGAADIGLDLNMYAAAKAEAVAKVIVNFNPFNGDKLGYQNKISAMVSAGIGVEGGVKVGGDTAGIGGTAGVQIGALGADADVDVGFENGKVVISVDVGFALAIGVKIKFDANVDAGKVYNGAANVVEGVGKGVANVAVATFNYVKFW